MKDPKVWLVIVGLAIGYPLSLALPVQMSWENAWIENTQTLILFFGAIFSCYAYAREPIPNVARLWLIAAPIWLILCARELSWGAVFFSPLHIDPLTGPAFSSTQQVPWRPFIPPLIGLLTMLTGWIFLREKHYQLFITQWRAGNFPVREILLVVAAIILCTEAESHRLIGFSSLNAGQQQLLEEWSEIWVYIAIFLAQWRLFSGLKTYH